MKIKNETEIQLMKILFKTSGKKPTKNITSQRAYPHGVEMKYFRQLKGFFKPLTDYVNKYIDEHLEPLLRGDSTEIHLDTIPGQSFRNMIYNLENWLSIYMPDISDLSEDSNNNVIFTALGKTADEAKAFGDKEFQKTIEKGIHVNPPTTSSWWEDMKNSWSEDNYSLITSNAKKYVSQINTLTEQAIVNGLSPAKLKEQIKKATEGLSDKHCKLLARDQMGKLNGQITESQMQEIGLDLYIWSTAYDDRVRDSHALMEGLLCRWDDASVCSYDNGKTWVARPSGAVDLHPGQDIQCRCVALAFYPELEAEMEGITLRQATEGLSDTEYINNFEAIPTDVKEIVKGLTSDPKKQIEQYTQELIDNSDEKIGLLLSKISKEKQDFVILDEARYNSAYNPKEQKIILNVLESSSTYRHELGHLFDHAILGRNGQVVFENGLVEKYRWCFSKTKKFEETYLKEFNAFVNKIKNEVKTKYNVKEIDKNQLKYYLMSKGFSKRERLIIQDMFVAKEKKDFNAHLVDYYLDSERVRQSKQFKNEKILADGFAELFDVKYSKDMSETFKKLIDDNFSESILIINNEFNNYLGV